jgi:hypothetical protein
MEQIRLGKTAVAQLTKKSSLFMEPGGSLPYSQESAIEPRSEPDEPSPYHQTLVL